MVIIGLVSCLVPIRKFGPETAWTTVKDGMAKLDKYVDDHVEPDGANAEEGENPQVRPPANDEEGDEEEDGTEKKNRVIGGVMTCGAIATAAMMAGVLIFIFIQYNVNITQALAPLDDSLLSQISTDLKTYFVLRSFTGCYEVRAIGIIAEYMYLIDYNASYRIHFIVVWELFRNVMAIVI